MQQDAAQDPRHLNMWIQDLSKSSNHRYMAGDAADMFEVTQLVSKTIQESFRPRSGNIGDQLLQASTNGSVVARVLDAKTATGKISVGTGVRFGLVDTSDPESKTAARASGFGGLLGALRSGNGTEALAMADVGATDILISVDRILEKINREHLDINNEEDRKKIKKEIERIAAHELGHSMGVLDNEDEHVDVMDSNAPSFLDQHITQIMKSELDKIGSSLDSRSIK